MGIWNWLNGKKTIIAGLLVGAAGIAERLSVVYPELAPLVPILIEISKYAGAFGGGHKVVKAIRK